MLFKGTWIGAASGKIASNVASHNRGGQYLRQHVIPTDPNTERQQAMRIAMSSAAEDWGTLGQDYWDAWARFASSVRRSNALGDEGHRSGFNEFIRWVVPRLFAHNVLGTGWANYPAIPAGPQIQLTESPECDVIDDGATFEVKFDNSLPWASDPDSGLMVYIAARRGAHEPPVNDFILAQNHYWRGPWYLAGVIRGNEIPPTSPQTFALANPLVETQKLPYKIRLSTKLQGMSAEVGGHARFAP